MEKKWKWQSLPTVAAAVVVGGTDHPTFRMVGVLYLVAPFACCNHIPSMAPFCMKALSLAAEREGAWGTHWGLLYLTYLMCVSRNVVHNMFPCNTRSNGTSWRMFACVAICTFIFLFPSTDCNRQADRDWSSCITSTHSKIEIQYTFQEGMVAILSYKPHHIAYRLEATRQTTSQKRKK